MLPRLVSMLKFSFPGKIRIVAHIHVTVCHLCAWSRTSIKCCTNTVPSYENLSQPYCANWPQHLILFFSLWIKFLIPLIILLASVPNDDAYNPDFENAMNEGKEVEYKLVYGITNDIHYLRSVFQNDASL